jgi:hypothetical protein
VTLSASIPLVDATRAGTKIEVLSAGTNSGSAYHYFTVDNVPVSNAGTGRGWNIATFDAVTCKLKSVTHYDTFANSSEFEKIVIFINSLESQTIVAMAINDEGTKNINDKAIE